MSGAELVRMDLDESHGFEDDMKTGVFLNSEGTWRVRFIRQKTRGTVMCCIISLNIGQRPLWAIGAGEDKNLALHNALRKIEVGSTVRQDAGSARTFTLLGV